MDTSNSRLTDACDNFYQGQQMQARMRQPAQLADVQQTNLPWVYRKIYAESPRAVDVTQNLLEPDGITLLTTVTNANVFTDNDLVTFKIPNTGYMDPQTVRLCFSIRPVVTTGTNNQLEMFAYDINTVFSRCRVLYDKTVLEDIQNYDLNNYLHSSLLDSSELMISPRSVPMGKTSVNAPLDSLGFNVSSLNNMNYTSPIHRRNGYHSIGNAPDLADNEVPANLPRRYMTIPFIGLFHQKKLIPTGHMGALEIEFTVNRGQIAFITGSANVNVTLEIGYPCLMYKEYKDQSMTQRLLNELRLSGQYVLQFPSWIYNSFQLTPPSGRVQQRQRFQIPLSKQRPKYLLACIRAEEDQTNTVFCSYNSYSSWFPDTNNTNGYLFKGAMPRVTSLRQYTVKYNGETLSPPVVYTGTLLQYGPGTTATSTSGLSGKVGKTGHSVGLQEQCTPPVDPLFYLDDCFGNALSHQKILPQRSLYDYFNGYVDTFTFAVAGSTLNGTNHPGLGFRMDQSTSGSNVRVPSSMIIAFPLSSTLPDGSVVCLPVGAHNEHLDLELEWNSPTYINSVTDTPSTLRLETFVCYDNTIRVNDDGLLTIIQ